MEALEHWRDAAAAAAGGSPLDPMNMTGINDQLLSLTEKSTLVTDPGYNGTQQHPLGTSDTCPSPVNERQVIPLPSSHSDQPKLPWTPLSDSALSLKECVEENSYTDGEDYTSYVWEAVRGTPMEDDDTMALHFQQSNSVIPTSMLEPGINEVIHKPYFHDSYNLAFYSLMLGEWASRTKLEEGTGFSISIVFLTSKITFIWGCNFITSV